MFSVRSTSEKKISHFFWSTVNTSSHALENWIVLIVPGALS